MIKFINGNLEKEEEVSLLFFGKSALPQIKYDKWLEEFATNFSVASSLTSREDDYLNERANSLEFVLTQGLV